MSSPNLAAADAPANWPEPAAEQVEVCLLGCYHMAQPENDAVNVQVDDVLAPERQRELQVLVDRLASWAPDLVAVEAPADRAEELNECYTAFRDGERAFDEPDEDALLSVRGETVQVGFRLAAELGHDRVYAIDDPVDVEGRIDGVDVAALEPADLWRPDEEIRAAHGLPDAEQKEAQLSERLAASTVPEYLRWLNTEQRLRGNQRAMFGGAIPQDRGDPPLGAVALGAWYERNLRIVQHLWNALADDDERALLVYGSGHVHVLRHLLDETPMTCPVSPLPLLAGDSPDDEPP